MGKHTAEHQGLEAIEYRRGMLETGTKLENLPVKIWRGIKMEIFSRDSGRNNLWD